MLQNGNIKCGLALRISIINHELKTFINSNTLFWKYISKDIGHKKFRNIHYLINSIKNTGRCRECGSKNGIANFTTSFQIVHVCQNCSFEKYSYSELVNRKQIFNFKRNGWRPKKRIMLTILNNLHRARRDINCQYLYWGFEFNNQLCDI